MESSPADGGNGGKTRRRVGKKARPGPVCRPGAESGLQAGAVLADVLLVGGHVLRGLRARAGGVRGELENVGLEVRPAEVRRVADHHGQAAAAADVSVLS